MMVPKKSLFLAGAALLFAGTVPSAQQGDNGPLFRRATEPLRTVSVDLQSGTITRGPVVQNKVASTCSSFNNNDFSGFIGVDSGPGGANGPCEWIDAGVKSGGKSEYMTGFQFAYCSAALDPASGGVGGYATLGFNEGYCKGVPGSGTEIFRVALTGLPANTACSSFFGGFNCYLISFTFGNLPVCYSDGKIGWSYQFGDLGTDGVLAKTFPFLACVQSCTGNGPDGSGMTDCIDQYCPSGTLLSTFQFGTTPFGGYFTSIAMDIREATPQSVATSSSNGTGVNPQGQGPAQPPGTILLTEIAGSPAIGKTWTTAHDCTGGTPPKSIIIRVSFAAPFTSPTGLLPVPIPAAWGEILVFITAGTGRTFIIGGASGIAFVLPAPIPKDLNFVCFPFSMQSFCGDNPLGYLTNAISATVGV